MNIAHEHRTRVWALGFGMGIGMGIWMGDFHFIGWDIG
jgi:hypothetical protein